MATKSAVIPEGQGPSTPTSFVAGSNTDEMTRAERSVGGRLWQLIRRASTRSTLLTPHRTPKREVSEGLSTKTQRPPIPTRNSIEIAKFRASRNLDTFQAPTDISLSIQTSDSDTVSVYSSPGVPDRMFEREGQAASDCSIATTSVRFRERKKRQRADMKLVLNSPSADESLKTSTPEGNAPCESNNNIDLPIESNSHRYTQSGQAQLLPIDIQLNSKSVRLVSISTLELTQ